MGQILVKRIITGIGTIFASSLLAFLFMFVLLPGDPAARLAGKNKTPQLLAEITAKYHFNKPWPVQYWYMMKSIFTGQITSFTQTGLKVDPFVLHALPVTFSLALFASIIWLTIGIAAGIRGAKNPGSQFDRISMIMALVGFSAPAAWLAIEMLYVFTSKIHLFPAGGYDTVGQGGLFGWAYHLLLPATSLAILSAGVYTRLTRTTVTQKMREEYIKTAVAKGLPQQQVFWKHTMRTALIPIVVMFGLDFGGLLGGAIFTESIFGLPGLGMVMMNAIKNFDCSVLMVGTIAGSFFIVVGNTVADLLQAALDPTVRVT